MSRTSRVSPSHITLADLLDAVRWDDDPARRVPSPLLPTARWFERFPWDGEEEPVPAVQALPRL